MGTRTGVGTETREVASSGDGNEDGNGSGNRDGVGDLKGNENREERGGGGEVWHHAWLVVVI